MCGGVRVCVCILNVRKQMGHHLSSIDKSVRRKRERKTAIREALLAERSQSVDLSHVHMWVYYSGCVCAHTVCVCMCGRVSLSTLFFYQ